MDDPKILCAGCEADIVLPDQPCPFCGETEQLNG